MIPAWRGIVDNDGDVWAWPMLLFDHKQAFADLPLLGKRTRARWRQWEPRGPIDFDPGTSYSDKLRVQAWVRAAS